MSAGFEKADTSSEIDGAPAEADLQTALFDVVCDSLSAAFIIYDKNDHLVFASRQILEFFPLPSETLKPGTRLRDFLGAMYDTGIRQQYDVRQGGSLSREDWLSQKIASHWRERFDAVERHGADRWVRFVKRRLPGGYGVTIISDISESKKREEQWRSDLERVQLTEDILDNLPFPLFVKDRNLTYVAVNLAFCEKYQTSADEVLGRKSGDLFSEEIAKRFEESDRHVDGFPCRRGDGDDLARADGPVGAAADAARSRLGRTGCPRRRHAGNDRGNAAAASRETAG